MPPSRSATFYLALAAGPGLFLLGTVARFWPAGARPLCLTHALTGLPCPGCGSFRALCLFVAGRWHDSWHMQPLMTLLYTGTILLSATAWLAWVFRIRTPVPRALTRREHMLLAAGAAAAVLLNWLYLLAARR